MSEKDSKTPLYTNQFSTNFQIHLSSFTVSVSPGFSDFSIYNYFGFEISDDLISKFDSIDPIPLTITAECMLTSDGSQLTVPLCCESSLFTRSLIKLPNILESSMCRYEYVFEWDADLEFPILFSELTKNAEIKFNFFANLFDETPKPIGSNVVRVFTTGSGKLRNGPFILDLETEETKETKLQKHFRKLENGRCTPYEFIDDQLIEVSNALHPNDAYDFYSSLLNPLEHFELSKCTKFAKIIILSPCKSNSIIYQKDLILNDENDLSNPCQELYRCLAYSQKFTNKKLLKDYNITEAFNYIKSKPPLSDLLPNQKSFLFTHYAHCFSCPELIPPLLRSVDWNDEYESKLISEQLNNCEQLDSEYVLEFLTNRYEKEPIRKFAIKCLSSIPKEELYLYIPQLLQGLKGKYTNGLSDVLIKHACDDVVFASTLYWNANIEKNETEEIKKFIDNLYNKLPKEIKQSLDQQKILVENIFNFLKAAQNNNKTPSSVCEKAKELLSKDTKYASKLLHFDKVRIPLNPTKIAIGIDPIDIKVFQSKLKPVLLSFILEDHSKYRVIFKIGDDMRQDQLIIQLFEVMDHIFQKASLKMPITAYCTLAFSKDFGCCEFIENSKAIRDIKDSKNGPTTIRGFFEEKNEF